MPYHPETTVIQGLARVRRERRLPPDAIFQPTHALTHMAVDAVQVVLQGNVLKEYRLFDVVKLFKLRSVEQAAACIHVEEGHRVQFGQEIARRGKGRGKVLLSPGDGEVIRVADGQIVLQISERTLEVQAKIPGEIENMEQRSVQVAGNGALIQCAWGNGAFCYEVFRLVPEEGIIGLSKLDVRISEYSHVVLISPYPLTRADLLVAQQHGAAGVVAPSMPSNLREFAMQLTFPVLLTEGFGQRRPTALIYSLLQSNMGRQAAFDAFTPSRWSWDRPEIMIPLPSGGVMPPVPVLDQPLAVGAQVRMTRAPWEGQIGRVVALPAQPQITDSGLRLPSARVELANGRVGTVPLANLELLG